jgi:hypothetical protein
MLPHQATCGRDRFEPGSQSMRKMRAIAHERYDTMTTLVHKTILHKTHSILARRQRACGRAQHASDGRSVPNALAALTVAWRLFTRARAA